MTFLRDSSGNAGPSIGSGVAPRPIRNRALLALFVFAAVLRIWSFTASAVVDPIRGDARDYFRYAANLVHHGVFSRSLIGPSPPVPDSFRDPGYPALLAVLMEGFGDGPNWYIAVLSVQAVLGAAACVLLSLLANRWLPAAWALAAGLLCAAWPHSISICGYLLSETLFGFAVVLALWLFARACERSRRLDWWLAGLSFGFSALVNGTIAPFFPFLAVGLLAARSRPPKLVIAALVMSLLLPGAWQLRSRLVDDGAGARDRVLINFLQGSWPDYHGAYVAAVYEYPGGPERMKVINDEQDLMLANAPAGLHSIVGRLKADPRRYALWYLQKPWELWGWNIEMGYGDIYVYENRHPIFLTSPAMHLFELICIAINPLVFLLAILTVIWLFSGRAGSLRSAPVPMSVAALLIFETLVYAVLQSEPRYSIPFRPLELALSVTALFVLSGLRRRPAKALAVPPGETQRANP